MIEKGSVLVGEQDVKLEFYLGSDYKVQCTVWYFFLHLYSQDRPYLPCSV